MPLPMVHLAVAREIARAVPRLSCPDFYLGSLAPDAIHARADATRHDKWKSHLRSSSPHPDFTPAFWESLPQALPGFPSDPFMAGYAAHLLTDYDWFLCGVFWQSFRAKNPDADEDKQLYYNDTDQADHVLYEKASWRGQVFSLLRQAQPKDVPGLVSKAEVALWRDHVFTWFRDYSSARYAPAHYVTPEEELAFAARSGQKISAFLLR